MNAVSNTCGRRQEQCLALLACVPRQGWLMKRSGGAGAGGGGGGRPVAGEWKRRFFVLDSSGQLFYYSQKASLRLICGTQFPGKARCGLFLIQGRGAKAWALAAGLPVLAPPRPSRVPPCSTCVWRPCDTPRRTPYAVRCTTQAPLMDKLRGLGSGGSLATTGVNLLTSTVKLDDEADPQLRFCFR
jgi:hypothetical protein